MSFKTLSLSNLKWKNMAITGAEANMCVCVWMSVCLRGRVEGEEMCSLLLVAISVPLIEDSEGFVWVGLICTWSVFLLSDMKYEHQLFQAWASSFNAWKRGKFVHKKHFCMNISLYFSWNGNYNRGSDRHCKNLWFSMITLWPNNSKLFLVLCFFYC